MRTIRPDTKRITACVCGCVFAVTLCGCGSKIPDMTEQQYNQTVEYAAGLLMKYSNNGVNKLTYLEPTYAVQGVDETPVTIDVATLPDPALSGDTTPDAPVVEDNLPEEEPEDALTDPFADDEEEPEAGDTVTVSQGEVQLLASGIAVGYDGYDVYSYYPADMSDVIISAELGDRLLVLEFTLENTTDEVIDVDFLTEDPVFRLTVNDVSQGRYRPTILEDDLSTLQQTLSPGEQINACLVVEVPEVTAEAVREIRLNTRYQGMNQTAIFD